MVKELPWSVGNAIELAKAHLQLDHRDEAIAAYTLALGNLKSEDLTRKEIEATLARLRAGEPLSQIRPVRNPAIE